MNDRQARYNLETMAWGTVAGARWVALLGFVAAAIGSASLRTGSSGAEALVPYAIGAVVLVGGWAGWAVWITRRVPRRLRRPLLLVARNCRPVLAMALAVGLLGLHSLVSMALWTLDASVVGALGYPLFWVVIITYWVSRSALRRRARRPGARGERYPTHDARRARTAGSPGRYDARVLIIEGEETAP